MEVPISVLYRRALDKASKASNMPTMQNETQDIVQSALSDLTTLRDRVIALSLFSPNSSESLSDIATRDLIYLSVPFVLAEVENRALTTGPGERIEQIGRAQRYFKEFIHYLESYEVVDESERKLYERRTSSVADPATRRELKIQQYKREKELRTKIEGVRARRRDSPTTDSSNDFDLIKSLLPSAKPRQQQTSGSDSEDDADTEDALRETTLLLLRLTYVQAQASLESIYQELELLRSMPSQPPSLPQPTEDTRGKDKGKEKDDMWKLDRPAPSGGPDGRGPLLDDQGKPLRPFTILPAGASNRARLQAQVFQPDHRLPTMSIDQYLAIEQQRGNIITGGGPASENQLTTSEQLQLDSEMDGTAFGAERAEAKRQKDESWAQYTDANPKGAGNTMNRG